MTAVTGWPPVVWQGQRARQPVYLCGVGARTPVGGAAAAAAAVRAGISAIALHRVFVDRSGVPMRLAVDPSLSADISVEVRLATFFESAAEEALAELGETEPLPPLPCWLAVADSRRGLPATASSRLREAAATLVPAVRDLALLPFGHASGVMAMQAAAQAVGEGTEPMALVVGVDSYHSAECLEALDAGRRLMSSTHRDGFPPGEGAGACVLAGAAAVERFGLSVLARVVAACTAYESCTIDDDLPCLGHGLSAAIAGATASLQRPGELVAATYCDLNGERYRSEERMYALLRTQEAFIDAHDYLSGTDCWGDVGAASGLLCALLAVASARRGYAKGRHALVWASSDGSERAAIVLELMAPRGRT